MWPWEHLAVGYLLYSLYTHLRGQGSPGTLPVLALVLATQMPDLIDKPLAWGLGILPGGRSLGHSLLFALPAIAVASVSGSLARRPRIAPAFALGYLSHLAGDVAYPLVVEGELVAGYLLWPIGPAAGSGATEGLPHVQELFMEFLAFLVTPLGTAYVLLEAGLVLSTFLLWVWDGMPGVRPVLDATVLRGRPERE